MRILRERHVSLFCQYSDHEFSTELKKISEILDETSEALEWVLSDLAVSTDKRGSKGMSAEEVLRAAILKQQHSWSYKELEWHLRDSSSSQAFVRVRTGQSYSDSCLQENIKKVSASTWEKLNRAIVRYAAAEKIEKGRVVRMDSTVVETNIHYPRDSHLIVDCLRVVSRLCNRLNEPMKFTFKKARKLMLSIVNSKNDDERRPFYEELIIGGGDVYWQLDALISKVSESTASDRVKQKLVGELLHIKTYLEPVLAQSIARVLDGKKVDSDDKVVSVFEEHTDVIVKGRRDVEFGHKIFLTTGISNMVLDCKIELGNPNDKSLFLDLLDTQKEVFGRYPRQSTADGGFASKENVIAAKKRGVKDVCFSKRCGLRVEELTKSSWVFEKLRKLRAGIEGKISVLKEVLHLNA